MFKTLIFTAFLFVTGVAAAQVANELENSEKAKIQLLLSEPSYLNAVKGSLDEESGSFLLENIEFLGSKTYKGGQVTGVVNAFELTFMKLNPFYGMSAYKCKVRASLTEYQEDGSKSFSFTKNCP